MSALQYNLHMRQGTAFRKVIRWLDAKGNPKLIANWTGHMQIKDAFGSSGFILDMTTENKEIVLIDGYVTLILSNARTATIPVDFKSGGITEERYPYQLNLTDLKNNARCFMEGSVVVKGSLF